MGVRPLTDHEALVAKERAERALHHARIATLRNVALADKAASIKAAEKLKTEVAKAVSVRKTEQFRIQPRHPPPPAVPWTRPRLVDSAASKPRLVEIVASADLSVKADAGARGRRARSPGACSR